MPISQKGEEKRKLPLGTPVSLTLGAETPRGGTRGSSICLIATDQLKTLLMWLSSFHRESVSTLCVLLLKTEHEILKSGISSIELSL